ncbi:MAG: ABC transporter ATP-binding protein [candidate division Zixibacteria bacterium]|nr:ABC transporter ATP-binding protein [candidate division Zixibacteria bacterium]
MKFLLPYWKYMLVSIISMFIFALLSGALIWMIGPLTSVLFQEEQGLTGITGTQTEITSDQSGVDSLSQGQRLASGFEEFREKIKNFVNSLIISTDRVQTLWNLCLAVLLLAIGKSIFYYLQDYFMIYAEQGFTRDLRIALFAHYQKLSISHFHGTRTGELISHVTNDIMILREAFNQTVNRASRDPLLILIYMTFMFIISWKLLLFVILILPLTFLLMFVVGRKLRKYSHRAQESMADLNSALEENVSNIRIIKGFNTDDYEIGKFSKHANKYFRTQMKISRFRVSSSPVNELLGTAAVVLIIWFGGRQVLMGNGISAGDFMLFAFAMFSLLAPVKSLFMLHIKVQEGMAAVDRIFRMLDRSVDIKDAPDAVDLPEFRSEIRFENVSFSYYPGHPVLKNINFVAQKGEIVAIVGSSGAGKSTLCDLIPRFYDPDQGRILIDGIDLRKIKLSSIRRLLGIVTQETMLFNDTVLYNITYGLLHYTMDQVEWASRIANAHKFISSLEKGYDTPIGNKGVMLSGGQRQRIAIARAVLRDPQILIFDEATSSLDTESEQVVQEAMDRLLKGRTTFVIAHRLSTILNADKILVIENGRLVESGTHSDLLARKGRYEYLYNLQFKEQNNQRAKDAPVSK